MAIEFPQPPPQPLTNTSLPLDTIGDAQFRSDALRATEKIIEDKFVEDKLNQFPLWAVASKSIKLSFLDEADVSVMSNLFEAEEIKYRRSIAPSQKTSDIYHQIGQARMIFFANMKRAQGTTDRNKMNERVALLSQVKQIYTSSMGTGGKGGGMVGGIKRMLRMK